jgi:LacI family transcriptional regulator
MPANEKSTVTDVARSAGVSLGTVSRVLNNAADVSPGIRERVLQAARTLNYTRLRQPRRTAQTERRGGSIATIVFGMEDSLVQLPVVSAGLQGIESALSSHGRSLMLATIPNGDRVPPFLQDGNVDGLLLKGPNQGVLPSEIESELMRHIYRFPHVWVMGRLPNARGDHCNFDTEATGRIVAEHLQVKGHQHVAFFNPKPGQIQFERVKTAFLFFAGRLGLDASLLEIEPPAKLVWPLPAITLQDNVEVLLERWLGLPKKTRPTALFVPSDRTAVQLYSALARRDLRAAEDVSVVSCNNERSLLMNLHPTLTSIDIHAEFIGRRSVEQLLWRIKHPHEANTVQILVEPTLVERDSVAQL